MMPFGLKNARFAYQRVVTQSQIGRNMEAYIDDMVVKKKQVVVSRLYDNTSRN